MSEAANLGDCKMAYLEPFDNGKRGFLVFTLKSPIKVNGKTTEHAGIVLEEEHLLQIVDGMNGVASMRTAARATDRIIKVVGS